VLGAIVALMLGGAALMGTMAFGGQKYFEYQALQAEATNSPAAPAPTTGTTPLPPGASSGPR
jgi:hypothetical protein